MDVWIMNDSWDGDNAANLDGNSDIEMVEALLMIVLLNELTV